MLNLCWIQGDNLDVMNLGNRIVNTYLIKIRTGYLLIDTGYSEQFSGFYKKITAKNIDLQEITYVFLTHAHDDHAGFLNDILASTNAKIILHKNALEGLYKGQNSFAGGCSSKLALVFCKAMSLFGKGEHRFPSLKEQFADRCIVVDDSNKSKLESELNGIIIETPGHTACSISLLMNNSFLFCGDAAMNGFPSIHRITIWVEDLEKFFASWKKILNFHSQKIYPGHGNPFLPSDLQRFLPKVQNTKIHPLT